MADRQEIMEMMRARGAQEQQDRLQRYQVLNEKVRKGEILFTGSSLMEQFPIDELRMTEGIEAVIYNRGVGGFTTEDMLQHMEEMVFATEPKKIFINIGTNDISRPGYRLEKLMENYGKIVAMIRQRLPGAEIYMMAYYPVNEVDKLPDAEWAKGMFATRTNENIRMANEAVKKLAGEMGCHYIDVNDGLTDGNGRLKKEYTIEGIHMYANGYRVVLENLRKYL